MNHIKTGTALLMMTFIMLSFSGTIYAHGQYFCKGKSAHVGQTMEEVKKALGEPLRIEQNEPQDQNGTSVEITKLIYKCESSIFALVFRNEALISIYPITENNAENDTE